MLHLEDKKCRVSSRQLWFLPLTVFDQVCKMHVELSFLQDLTQTILFDMSEYCMNHQDKLHLGLLMSIYIWQITIAGSGALLNYTINSYICSWIKIFAWINTKLQAPWSLMNIFSTGAAACTQIIIFSSCLIYKGVSRRARMSTYFIGATGIYISNGL